MKNKYIYIISIIILLIDQISKLIVINTITYLKEINIIPNFFSLMYVKNTGGAFSIFNNNVILLTIISVICLIFIIKYIIKNNKKLFLEDLSIAFITGGLLGNLIDRIFRSGVIDFFKFKIITYDFPIFNIADIFIVIGIFIIMISTIRGEIHENRKGKCKD